jgi:hypothetical protein
LRSPNKLLFSDGTFNVFSGGRQVNHPAGGLTWYRVDGHAMRIFQRRVDQDESLTFGGNTEDVVGKPCNMYIVFVNTVR